MHVFSCDRVDCPRPINWTQGAHSLAPAGVVDCLLLNGGCYCRDHVHPIRRIVTSASWWWIFDPERRILKTKSIKTLAERHIKEIYKSDITFPVWYVVYAVFTSYTMLAVREDHALYGHVRGIPAFCVFFPTLNTCDATHCCYLAIIRTFLYVFGSQSISSKLSFSEGLLFLSSSSKLSISFLKSSFHQFFDLQKVSWH